MKNRSRSASCGENETNNAITNYVGRRADRPIDHSYSNYIQILEIAVSLLELLVMFEPQLTDFHFIFEGPILTL